MRSGRMRLERVHILPFLQHDECVRADLVCIPPGSLSLYGRSVFEYKFPNSAWTAGMLAPNPRGCIRAAQVWR